MKLIVGLGNPGDRYAATRHNVGWRVLDRYAVQQGWAWSGTRDRASLAQGVLDGDKVVLAKPQTYMNESGLAVGPLMRFYKLTLADLLVVCDDLDLAVGRVRLREKGSSGGQRGVESIITHLGANGFARLRVGIGRPEHPRIDPVDHVLGAPRGDERLLLEEGEERAVAAIAIWLRDGLTVAMNQFNPDPQQPAKVKPAQAKPSEPQRDPTPAASSEPV